MTKRFGKNDAIFLLILIVLVAGIGLYNIGLHKRQGAELQIEVKGQLYGCYPLNLDANISVKQNINGVETVTNYVLIENGKATMSEATCPDLLCVYQKDISKEGEMIVCLPNQVVLQVLDDIPQDYDGISQ